jgi:8-oxo-dGTP diphosphatase
MNNASMFTQTYRHIITGARQHLKIVAFGIIFNDQRQVLLCHKRKIDLWNLPGGQIEKAEIPREAVIREIREEVGLEVKVLGLAGIYLNPPRKNVAFSYLCEVTGGQMQTSKEADDIDYFTYEHMPRYTSPYHKVRIKDALDRPTTVHLKLQFGPSHKKLIKSGKL